MLSAFRHIDQLLRASTLTRESTTTSLARPVLTGLLFAIFYGAVMGCYGGIGHGRILQPLYSGLKVPLLLGVTFLLSLPSFYVLNMLLGLGEDFRQTMRALAATQAVLSIVLASLSPFTVLWYASFSDHDEATLFNAAMFAIASGSGQWVLRRHYKPLIVRNPRHRWMLRFWLILYSLIAIQMAWIFRPFIGAPGMPVQFLRPDSWDNAYVMLAGLLKELIW